MNVRYKLLTWFANGWCMAFAGVYFLSMLWSFHKNGLFYTLALYSPFDIANFIVTAVMLAPAIICWALAEKFK